MAEALALLVLAWLMIRVLPFRVLSTRLVAGGPAAFPSPEQHRRAMRVRRAIRLAARSWAVCLPQALAANWMLGLRGIGSTVCLGVRRDPDDGRLDSHAWLRVGDGILIGSRQVSGFAQVAQLPLGGKAE